MQPFDRHEADTGLLEEAAAALTSLSNQAIDQRDATLAAFNPARDGWDGVAAAELRHAPDGVQQDAYEVSSAVAWGAVPLRYWVARVNEFNARAAEIEEAYHQRVAATLAMPADPAGSPSMSVRISDARAEARREYEEQYRQAHEDIIVAGAEVAARMYREGPTEDNLRAANAVHAIPVGAGAAAVFPQLWHEGNMRIGAAMAEDAVAIARRILADGEPSEQDLRRLSELLEQYGDYESFAFHLLHELGPRGLLDLTANVAVLVEDGEGSRHDGQELRIAEMVGTIQAGLGVALATATNRSSGSSQYDLSERWEERLLDAGDERLLSEGTYFNPYGYQVLGVLLSNPDANYETEFLLQAGDRMLDFELEYGSSSVWSDPFVQHGEARLNWVHGHGDNDPYGADPMGGLMIALRENPEAAREFFSTPSRVDGDTTNRVAYLVTERFWDPDAPLDLAHEEGAMKGVVNLGAALNVATADTSNHDAAQIVRDIVRSVGDNGVTDGRLREPLADVTANWIGSMYNAMRGEDTDWTNLNREDMGPFLVELGRNGEARSTVVQAAALHATERMMEDFANAPGGNLLADRRSIENAADPAAQIMRAVDVGEEQVEFTNAAANEQRVNRIVSAGLGLVPVPGGQVGAAVFSASGLREGIAEAYGPESQVSEDVAALRSAARDTLEANFWVAAGANGGPTGADQAARMGVQLDAEGRIMRDDNGDPIVVNQEQYEQGQLWLDLAEDVVQTYVSPGPVGTGDRS